MNTRCPTVSPKPRHVNREAVPADRRALLVGLLALGAPPTGPAAMARNDVVNAIYAACGVTLGG